MALLTWHQFPCPGGAHNLINHQPGAARTADADLLALGWYPLPRWGKSHLHFVPGHVLQELPIMPQSLARNLIHLIFSTKDRRLLIRDSIRNDLHNYAGGILRDPDSPALFMNSVDDHIHLLFNLHRTKALSDVVR